MSGFLTKRRLAAVLCAAMLCLLAAAAALAEEATPNTASMFSLSLEVEDGVCTITVTHAQNFPIVVSLLNESGNAVANGSTMGNGMAEVNLTESGTYHAVGWFERYPNVTVSSEEIVYTKPQPQTNVQQDVTQADGTPTDGTTENVTPIVPIVPDDITTGGTQTDDVDLTIRANVSVSGDTISVTVTQSDGDRPMGVMLGYDDVRENVMRGQNVTFSGLSAGSYEIEIDYMDRPYCPDPFSQTVTVQGAADGTTTDVTPIVPIVPGTPADSTTTDVTPIVPIVPGTPADSTPTDSTTTDVTPIVPIVPGTPTDSTPTDSTTTDSTPADGTPTDGTPAGSVDLTIRANVSVSGDAISVTVTQSDGDRPMGVMLGYDDVRENVMRGQTVTFSGLSAGSYEIEIDYMDRPYCPDPFSQTVTVQGAADGTPTDVTPIVPGTPTDSTPTDSTPADGAPTDIIPIIPIVPSTPTDSTPAAPTQFEIEAGVSDGEVFVKITNAVDWELEARLLDKATGNQVGQTSSRIGNGQLSLGKPQMGSYIVTVSYVTPAEGIAARTQEITIDKNPETPAEPTAPTVTQIEASVETGMDSIAVTVTQADSWQLYIAVGNLEPKLAYLGDTVHFAGLEKGKTYDIETDYVNAVPGVSPFRTSVTLPAASAITATAAAGVERVDVSVTAASALPVMVTLKQGETVKGSVEIAAGTGAIAFTGLAAGVYSVSVDYKTPQIGVSPTVIDGLNVLAGRAAITDLAAVAGENQISITGRAQPNTDVTLTTEPASATAIVRADERGSFTTTIVCAAGTYTAINAQYGAEAESRVTLRGIFSVTAPAVRPTLEVDPIANNALTVIARTTPGVKVNLSTGDYAQTVTADANGLMRYSLPHTYPTGTVVTFTVWYGVDNVQSYQQTVTVVNPIRYSLLRRGSVGYEVYDLTLRLEKLGYPIGATTRYNDSVVAAVRLFQRANGLAVDGMAGQATQTALYSLAAVRYGGEGEYPTLVRGDRGLALIYTLQQRLKDLGYYSIRVDGIYGSGTQRAVRWFQQVNGLTATGTADSVTQKLLYSSEAKPASGWSGGSYDTLSRSNRYNARVVTLQRRLKALGYLSGSVDGYFGTQTYRAVRSFQSRNGLTVTGVADPYTQEVLYSASARAAAGSSSSGTTGYSLLYWGCRGEAVRRLQQALLDAGYKQVRKADGIYGQWTYDAVRAFQKDHGLSVDGIAGKNTQNALYGTSY